MGNTTDSNPLCHTPLHASHYADSAEFSPAAIIENVRLATDTYRMRLDASSPAVAKIAQRIVPGQFIMVRVAGLNDPMLGRAFALYDVARDTSGKTTAIDFVYAVHGKLTSALASCLPGQSIEIWGPLGNGIVLPEVDHLIMVAGGIGQTPFVTLGKESLGQQTYGDPVRSAPQVKQATLCYGVRSADRLAGEADFRSAGIDLRIASDDGSIGHAGLVTELLAQALEETTSKSRQVVCCGPEPMMEAAAKVCQQAGAPCLVSLETPMACGIGICFSCVAKVMQPDGEWDYKRTCVEGPVFDAEKIVW